MGEDEEEGARPPPSGSVKSDASGQAGAREARLAAALRANLKRRKAADRRKPPER